MATEAGEYIVGAWLQHFRHCSFITYNARIPGGKLSGLNELDVVGLNLTDRRAYLCESTAHISGMTAPAVAKVAGKHLIQRKYAAVMLDGFDVSYQVWSPKVSPAGVKTLGMIEGLECVLNEEYAKRVAELRLWAKNHKHDTGNPVTRTLQILEALKV